MTNELKRSKCLEEIHSVVYHSSPSLIASGRYLKALRHSQTLTNDDNKKLKYEYVINRGLQKHIMFLQESIINGYNNIPNTKKLTISKANMIRNLATSEFKVSNGKFCLVDVDGLKKMEMLKKAVLLDDPLVLPCKVKSENNKYKFNTQIIMTRNNVLSYASYNLEYTSTIKHNVLVKKVGRGIRQNELIEKASRKATSEVRI